MPSLMSCDHVLERGVAAFDRRVGHAHDGRIAIAGGARVAGRLLAHLGRRLARVQAPDQDAVLDQVAAPGGRAFVVVLVRAAQSGQRTVVEDGEDVLAKAPPQDHHLLRLGVFVDKVGFGEVSERLVDKDACQAGVEDDRVLPADDRLCAQEVDCALGCGLGQVLRGPGQSQIHAGPSGFRSRVCTLSPSRAMATAYRVTMGRSSSMSVPSELAYQVTRLKVSL